MITAIAIVAVLFIAATWDAFRRYVDAVRFNQQALERIEALTRETERVKEQTHAVMQKVQATQAAQATRNVTRLGR